MTALDRAAILAARAAYRALFNARRRYDLRQHDRALPGRHHVHHVHHHLQADKLIAARAAGRAYRAVLRTP